MADETTHELPPPSDEALGSAPLEDDEWPVRGPARGIRLGLPAAALVAILLVTAGLWGGAYLQRHHGTSTSGGSNLASIISRFRRGGTGTTGAGGVFSGGAGGTGSSATTGTISVVSGNTLWVLTSTGSLVKVTLGSSTTISRNAKSDAVGLRPGDTVVVQGSAETNGNVAATSVSATAPGVSSGTGAFGGFGG